MKYTGFNSAAFQAKVDKALNTVKRILETNRQPKLAAEVHEHQYEDKYALTEFLTNTAIAAQWNVFERLNLTPTHLRELQEHVEQRRSVTLRFEAEDSCSFLKEATVDVVTYEDQVETESNSSQTGTFFTSSSTSKTEKRKVVQKVKEYHWKIGMTHKLMLFAGPDPTTNNPIELQSRTSSTTVITTGVKQAPFPDKMEHAPVDVNITWFVRQVVPEGGKKADSSPQQCAFSIDRTSEADCRTPVRNQDIKASLKFFQSISLWSMKVATHFKNRIEHQILGRHSPASPATRPKNADLRNLSVAEVFFPVLPLLEDPEGRDVKTRSPDAKSKLVLLSPSVDGSSSSSPLLSLGDIDFFLNEQIRSLDAALGKLSRTFAPHQLVKLITVQEASLTLLCMVNMELFTSYFNSIYYVEDMLKKQLVAAIGKEVQPKDFDAYMSWHFGKLMGEEYAAKPFCYAIRRPNHYPDGVLSIERAENRSSSMTTPPPVQTMVRVIGGDSAPPMQIPINAATKVSMTGDRYLHGWIQHQFESAGKKSFELAARARQFSSFLLMVGVMGGANEFHPKDAIILQNKDEVFIPLLLHALPTAKDFKDAVASLSPEQQRFARSFRGMQLESSVFGICIVQLKPQLEVLLGLPNGALTKEIRLTQNLMSLFMDYQIPSDLLSFDGGEDATLKEKVDVVKGHVKTVMDVIEDAKQAQLEQKAKEAAMSVSKMVAGATAVEADMPSMRSMAFQSPAPRAASSSAMMTFDLALKSPSLDAAAARRQLQSAASVASAGDTRRAPGESADSRGGNAPGERSQSSIVPVAYDGSTNTAPNDFTMIPKQLDTKFEEHDTDNSVRATIIETAKTWTRKRQENLLTKIQQKTLMADDVKTEKNKAFDLLDALSRSGSLEIACAELHVVVAVTHWFENDVMGTVIQDNINPIEKVERTTMMVASTIHGMEPSELIKDDSEKQRLASTFPTLFAPPVDLLSG